MLASRRPTCPLVLAALLLTAAAAHAQSPIEDASQINSRSADEFTSARPVAMGGAFVGGGNSNGAIFYNPAGIMSARVYSLEAGYGYAGGPDHNSFGVSVVDSKTNPSLAAAVSYSMTLGRESDVDDADPYSIEQLRDHDFRAVLAVPIVPETLALGVGMHYAAHRRDYVFPGESTAPETGDDPNDTPGIFPDDVATGNNDPSDVRNKDVSLDVGVLGTFANMFTVGFAAQNLLQPSGYEPQRRMSGGIGLFIEAVHIEVAYTAEQEPDTTVLVANGEEDFQPGTEWKHTFALGLEYTLQTVPVRLGYRNDGLLDANYVTGGFGFRSPVAGFDAGYRQNVQESRDRYVVFSISGYM